MIGFVAGCTLEVVGTLATLMEAMYMPESAGSRVDTHVHPHVSELTKEELEAKRQAGVAKEEEDERKKDEEEKTPPSIWENPRQSDSPPKMS